jgi:hypothetical protein
VLVLIQTESRRAGLNNNIDQLSIRIKLVAFSNEWWKDVTVLFSEQENEK